jgi:hypothetical protein
VSLHHHLVRLIIEANQKTPSAAGAVLPGMSDDEVMRMIFDNLRTGAGNEIRGLKLSQGGLALMTTYFKAYPIVFEDQQIFSSRHILYLDRTCKMPWHADAFLPITITFFEPELAMRAKLVGDLDLLMSAFSG